MPFPPLQRPNLPCEDAVCSDGLGVLAAATRAPRLPFVGLGIVLTPYHAEEFWFRYGVVLVCTTDTEKIAAATMDDS